MGSRAKEVTHTHFNTICKNTKKIIRLEKNRTKFLSEIVKELDLIEIQEMSSRGRWVL